MGFDIEWRNVLLPTISWIEIILRGTVMYLSIFTLLRVTVRRNVGSLGISDLLLITLLADASQNAMAGEYKSLPDGILLVSTIIFWSYALDRLSFKYTRLRHWIEPPPLPLVKDGRLLYRNMRRELISEEELKAQLREQGMAELEDVKEARIESDGRISVVPREEKASARSAKKKS
ncbi:MAG TPA: YetF domain-containing protein [Candidatus Binatia bacterium]|jgi:uncharacterized membrane protein YcaP (DUF421 family)